VRPRKIEAFACRTVFLARLGTHIYFFHAHKVNGPLLIQEPMPRGPPLKSVPHLFFGWHASIGPDNYQAPTHSHTCPGPGSSPVNRGSSS